MYASIQLGWIHMGVGVFTIAIIATQSRYLIFVVCGTLKTLPLVIYQKLAEK